jgi:competence protein ComEA
MFKKLLLAVAAFIAAMGIAFAQVEVNKADQAALDGVKGIGPATSKAIIAERKKGDFKDWADLEKRVKGIGEKKAAALSKAGLVVNGQALAGAASASASAKADKKAASAPASASAKADDKKAASSSASAKGASAPASASAPAPAASGSASATKK